MERLTARKVPIDALQKGYYVVKEGTEPNRVETPYGQVSRANIIAAVIGKPSNDRVLLDDGSAQMEARAFDDNKLFSNIMVGDIILLIGRPREYQGKRYLVAEIAKRLGTPRWLELRNAELKQVTQQPIKERIIPETAPEPKAKIEEVVVNKADALLKLIKESDKGTGVAIEDIIARDPGAEATLTDLMADGEIFEIKPGRVKVLE